MLRLQSCSRISSSGHHAGETGFVLEFLVGVDDVLDVLVGEEALGAFAGDLVDGVDEEDLGPCALSAWPCGR